VAALILLLVVSMCDCIELLLISSIVLLDKIGSGSFGQWQRLFVPNNELIMSAQK
jgi:hypothetical protein